MQDVQKAAFQINDYSVKSFTFIRPLAGAEGLEVEFNPSGSYTEADGKFIMLLDFTASFKKEKELAKFVECSFETIFEFPNKPKFEEMPDYFYRNALGIVFPYLRAFISTLTFQSNIKPLILPLLNLTSLDNKFKKQTEVIKADISKD